MVDRTEIPGFMYSLGMAVSEEDCVLKIEKESTDKDYDVDYEF